MNLPRIVGLNGLKRSGKDTIGNFLVREYGFTRLSFAAPLYDAVYQLNPQVAHTEVYWDWDCEEQDATTHVWLLQQLVDRDGWESLKEDERFKDEVRRLLERMGTEVGRNLFGEDFWVTIAVSKILDKRYVFTDARFPNEFAAIRAYKPDSYLLKVIRPGLTPNGHASDQDWPNEWFDGSVLNDDTIPALESRVYDMLRVGR